MVTGVSFVPLSVVYMVAVTAGQVGAQELYENPTETPWGKALATVKFTVSEDAPVSFVALKLRGMLDPCATVAGQVAPPEQGAVLAQLMS